MISETWFKWNQTALYEIHGYTSNHSCRKARNGAGLSTYTKQSHHITKVHLYESTINAVAIELKNIKSCNSVTIVGINRPPINGNHSIFIDYIEQTLNRIGNTMCMFAGDFNINLENDITNNSAIRFQREDHHIQSLIICFQMQHLVTTTTHIQ